MQATDDQFCSVDLNGIEPNPHSSSPEKVWRDMEKICTRRIIKPLPLSAPKKSNSIRVVCISDTHCKLGSILSSVPPGDILIHAGDFTYMGWPNEVEQFNKEIGQFPHKVKIVIAGNHEISFDPTKAEEVRDKLQKELRKYDVKNIRDLLTNCTYLEDDELIVHGYRFYGSPWQPTFCDWAFNVARGAKILEKWRRIPKNTDVLITHGPPLGYGDVTIQSHHVGCVDLLNVVQNFVKPKFHVFGHIHEGYGITSNGETTFINASTCTVRYKPVNMPIIFDLPRLE